MFVYCGNNAANRLDPTGQYMVGVDFLNRAGGFVGLSSSVTGGGANTTSRNVAKNNVNKNNKASRFSPGKRKAKELVQVVKRDVMSVVREVNSLPDKYPEIKVYKGGKNIKNGVNNISKGAALLYAPVPTVLDDVIGVGFCAYGVMQAAGGLVTVLLGFESL